MDRRQTGVRPRGSSIIIDFTYQGDRCRESLRIRPTQTALKEANRKREAILYEIAMGTFEYSRHFPNSKKAYQYSNNKGALITIEQALKAWIKRAQKRCEHSTIKDYNSVIYYHLIPAFGELTLDDLTIENIYTWMEDLDISNKRINNVLSPLRQVYREAYLDGIIDRNPLDRFRNLPNHQRDPSPFSPDEIKKILGQLDGQANNLVQFAFWTGLRSSELIALRWEDVDLSNQRIYVRKAIVSGREKTTKTASGRRTVELQPMALKALKSQRQYTNGAERVFYDPKTNEPWASDQPIRKRVWIPALRAAEVKYRNPYQTRHTYASMMLSQGKNPLWVAQQMGHKDWGMIRKVYGRWIPQ